jgi:MarR family transcriptional regulator, organic hydroperoxide resistance regulator
LYVAPTIQDEIKQRKPFSSLEEETALALSRTADLIHRPFDELFKAHGITGTQYNVLRILRGAGPAGIPCSEIGGRMVTRDPDITRLLDRMERLGLCARTRDRKDRRVILSRITAKGLDLLKQLDRPAEELNKKILGHMGESRLRSLCRLLQAARGG